MGENGRPFWLKFCGRRPLSDIMSHGGGSDSSGSDAGFSDPGNLGEWHPFENKVHAQLVLLFLGSHRRNFDLVTFRAFLTILKVKSFTKKYPFNYMYL